MKTIDYKGWTASVLDAGKIQLYVPHEVGPRVLYCGGSDGVNLFAEVTEQDGGRGEDTWCIRGGHRLWHSPEHPKRTYVTDNAPVSISGEAGKLQVEQAVEAGTGMVKTMIIEALNPASFKVTHILRNEGLWPVECAAWALSVMKHGGYAAIPLLPKESHEGNLLPKYHMVPWTYTNFAEPAWNWHTDFIGVDVSQSRRPQKLGLSNYPGWTAYWQPAGTFVKYSPVISGAVYPDFGSAFETFHCDWMIEMETLSPLVQLQPGAAITHIEYWGVLHDLERFDNAETYNGQLVPAVSAWLAALPQ